MTTVCFVHFDEGLFFRKVDGNFSSVVLVAPILLFSLHRDTAFHPMEHQCALFGCASKVQKSKNKGLDSPRKAHKQPNARVFMSSDHGIKLCLKGHLHHEYGSAANCNKLCPVDYRITV